MNLVVDENLPRRLADWLRANGHAAVHVSEIGLMGQPDDVIWDAALGRGACVVTRDGDFIRICREAATGTVIRLLVGNCPTAVLIARVKLLWPGVEARISVGEPLIEVG